MARGYAPVAVVLLVAVTVLAAAGVLVALPGLSVDPPPKRGAVAEATADGRVSLTLLSGPEVDADSLDVRVVVDGEPLRHQPPVPFFAAHGFRSGPTGPFNVAADSTWQVGESATFRVAATNSPTLSAGADVDVELRVRGSVVAVAGTTVEEQSERRRSSGLQWRQSALSRHSASSARLASRHSPLARTADSFYSSARATVAMARGLPGLACSTRCSTSTKPASRNIRSASSSS